MVFSRICLSVCLSVCTSVASTLANGADAKLSPESLVSPALNEPEQQVLNNELDKLDEFFKSVLRDENGRPSQFVDAGKVWKLKYHGEKIHSISDQDATVFPSLVTSGSTLTDLWLVFSDSKGRSVAKFPLVLDAQGNFFGQQPNAVFSKSEKPLLQVDFEIKLHDAAIAQVANATRAKAGIKEYDQFCVWQCDNAYEEDVARCDAAAGDAIMAVGTTSLIVAFGTGGGAAILGLAGAWRVSQEKARCQREASQRKLACKMSC